MQESLWSEQEPAATGQEQPAEKKPARARRTPKMLPMATPSVTLWGEQRPEAMSIAELQEFVRNYQYQPRPVPTQSLELEQTAKVDIYAPYEIMYTNPISNIWSARGQRAEAIVSLSGGLGSALAAERAIQKHGRENVILWFADVLDENEDLYRFLHDLMRRWGGRLYWYTDGRHPADVWDEHKLIPNSLIAPCTYELKVQPFREFILAMPSLPIVYIGFKVNESKRHAKTLQAYKEAIPDARVEYPLLWTPQEDRDLMVVCQEELGIDPPLLYKLGYDYNNCGGGCCRSGIKAWMRTAIFFPDVFARRSTWEQQARAEGGARENRSFAARQRDGEKQALTLEQIQQEYVPQAPQMLKLRP